MKTALVCTDFSQPSTHAADYACLLAGNYNFPNITLLHTFQGTIPPTPLPPAIGGSRAFQQVLSQQLQSEGNRLATMTGPATLVHTRLEEADLGESINAIGEQENADLVVLGMHHKSGFEKVVSGSHTVSVAEHSRYPVLMVPDQATLQPVKSLLLACDLSRIVETTPLGALEEVLNQFKVPLTVLNVAHDRFPFSGDSPKKLHDMHSLFDRYRPTYAFTKNKNITDGILEYANDNHISMIITIVKNYNFFQQVFLRNNSEKLMYRSHIPVLSLHTSE